MEVIPLLHRAHGRRVELDFPHPKPPEVQLAASRLVRERDGVTVRELAEALLTRTGNASAMITRMAAAGPLRPERGPADRRVLHLHLTDEARRRVEEAHDPFTGHVPRASGSPGEDDQGRHRRRAARPGRLGPRPAADQDLHRPPPPASYGQP
ncbi:MarR family transcriptional regulator [Nonomuraea wenchangensis]